MELHQHHHLSTQSTPSTPSTSSTIITINTVNTTKVSYPEEVIKEFELVLDRIQKGYEKKKIESPFGANA
jgi:hypothetical protein